MISQYPVSDAKTRLVTTHSSFTVEDSGNLFQWRNNLVQRTVVYTNEVTGTEYRVVAIAWEVNGGARIQKALYINNAYQYQGASTLLKHSSDNALFGYCAHTENAVRNILAHAECLVKAMALKASADMQAEIEAVAELAGVS